MEGRDSPSVSNLDTGMTRWEMLCGMDVDLAGLWMSEHFICPPLEDAPCLRDLIDRRCRDCANCWTKYLLGVEPDD